MSLDTAAVTPDDVKRAAHDLRTHLRPTPLQPSPGFSEKAGCRVYLKLESVQPIRSFKVRGALNKVMRIPVERRAAGVITASAGNHGMGVAYAAAEFGMHATVHVPDAANAFKVQAIRRLGARVVTSGSTYQEAYTDALAEQKETGATFVHAYDDRDVIAGQGTIGLELLDDLEDFDTVIVPVGGGGLIGGIALYVKSMRPSVRVIGVEPEGADALRRSLQAGRIWALDEVKTFADGLAASAPGPLTLDLAQRYVDEVVTVSDDEMLDSIRLLFELEHLLAEPAGAAGIAALLLRHKPAPSEKVVVIHTGANVTDEVMIRALAPR